MTIPARPITVKQRVSQMFSNGKKGVITVLALQMKHIGMLLAAMLGKVFP